MRDIKEIKIDIKLLEKIAQYYEFPVVVFFGGNRLRGTRKKSLTKMIYKYRKKIDKVFKEFLEEI